MLNINKYYGKNLPLCTFLCVYLFVSSAIMMWCEQSFEEMFKVVFCWIKKTLLKPSVRSNVRPCIFLKPLPSNFIIFFMFCVILKIYHGSGGWLFKRYSIIIITFIGRYVWTTWLRWWWMRGVGVWGGDGEWGGLGVWGGDGEWGGWEFGEVMVKLGV